MTPPMMIVIHRHTGGLENVPDSGTDMMPIHRHTGGLEMI